MDDQKMKTGVGILVIASGAITIMLTFFFGAFPALLTNRYTVTARFPAAPGVGVDTPVQRNGVKIGRVTGIELLPEEGVNLTMELEREFVVPQGQVPQISTGSLVTGDAIVEFVAPSPQQLVSRFDGTANTPPDGTLQPEERRMAMQPIPDEAFLTGGTVEKDPFAILAGLETDMRDTLQAVRGASEQFDRLAGDVRLFISGGTEGPISNLMGETQLAIDDFRTTMNEIQNLVGDPELRTQIEASLQRLPSILDEAGETLKTAQNTLESFERAGRSAERTFDNVERFTRPLGERGEDLVDNMLVGLENLNRTLAQVSDFGDKLNNSDGTLNRLIEDEELYYSIKRTVHNVETATVKLRPILDDVRILTDKLARDPRQLGVRGALGGRATGTGLK